MQEADRFRAEQFQSRSLPPPLTRRGQLPGRDVDTDGAHPEGGQVRGVAALAAAEIQDSAAASKPEQFGARAVVFVLGPVEPRRLAAGVRRSALGPLSCVGVPGDRRVCHCLLRSWGQPPGYDNGRLVECLTSGTGVSAALGAVVASGVALVAVGGREPEVGLDLELVYLLDLARALCVSQAVANLPAEDCPAARGRLPDGASRCRLPPTWNEKFRIFGFEERFGNTNPCPRRGAFDAIVGPRTEGAGVSCSGLDMERPCRCSVRRTKDLPRVSRYHPASSRRELLHRS